MPKNTFAQLKQQAAVIAADIALLERLCRKLPRHRRFTESLLKHQLQLPCVSAFQDAMRAFKGCQTVRRHNHWEFRAAIFQVISVDIYLTLIPIIRLKDTVLRCRKEPGWGIVRASLSHPRLNTVCLRYYEGDCRQEIKMRLYRRMITAHGVASQHHRFELPPVESSENEKNSVD